MSSINEDEQIYYELLKDYWQDGVITEKEQAHLDEMREDLNISPERAFELEESVKKELGIIDADRLDEDKLSLYRKLLESFSRKGIVEDKKKELLNKKGDALGIPRHIRDDMEAELYYERAIVLRKDGNKEEGLLYISKAVDLMPEKILPRLESLQKEEDREKKEVLKKEEEKSRFKKFVSLQLKPRGNQEEEAKRAQEIRRELEEEKMRREEERKKREEEESKKLKLSDISPRMVFIEGGEFFIGSNKGKPDETPVHKVILNSFYMSACPVLNKEYCSYKPETKSPGEYFPVVSVTWYDALKYCNWLSEHDGLDKCYEITEIQKRNVVSWILGDASIEYTVVLNINKNGYRLPTEAEWEYACRAGSINEYYWGNETDPEFFWYNRNSEGKIHPAGQKKPNKSGLFDMSGNVWEWCWDSYDKNYYSESSFNNPPGPASGSYRVRRGGSYKSDTGFCRSAARGKFNPPHSDDETSFRIVRNS